MTQLDIINRALLRIKAATINSLQDRSLEGEAARLEWDTARDSALRGHDWGFASRRARLALLPEKPHGRAFAYAEPADCVMIRRVLPSPDAGPDGPGAPFAMGNVGGVSAVLADVPSAAAEYTARIANAGLYDPIFIEALTSRLASSFALAVKGDGEAAGTHLRAYERILSAAATRNAQEGGFEDERISSFELARLV